MPNRGGLSRRAALALVASASLSGCNFGGSNTDPSTTQTRIPSDTQSGPKPELTESKTASASSGDRRPSSGFGSGGFGTGAFGGADAE